MKKLIRLTESDLHRIVRDSVNRILREDVLGNDWNADESDVMNNYEPFEAQKDRDEAETEFRNQHDWETQGEENFDPSFYPNQHLEPQGWNDDEPEGYEEDPDWYRDDVSGINDSPSDGDLYRGMW